MPRQRRGEIDSDYYPGDTGPPGEGRMKWRRGEQQQTSKEKREKRKKTEVRLRIRNRMPVKDGAK